MPQIPTGHIIIGSINNRTEDPPFIQLKHELKVHNLIRLSQNHHIKNGRIPTNNDSSALITTPTIRRPIPRAEHGLTHTRQISNINM
ncbi:hypothetical protein Hdeb2414_s0010g00349391 [Helianthus debilis subsp. tardiflorus]